MYVYGRQIVVSDTDRGGEGHFKLGRALFYVVTLLFYTGFLSATSRSRRHNLNILYNRNKINLNLALFLTYGEMGKPP